MNKIIDFSKYSPLAQCLIQMEIKIVFSNRCEYFLARTNGEKQALKEVEELKKQIRGACIKGIIIDEAIEKNE